MTPPAIECSPTEAQSFIAALTGDAETEVTFQTFADSDAAKARGVRPRILHGTVTALWSQLVALNAEGQGVFVMVNEGDLKGRREENVIALRAVFVDDDGDAGAPVAFAGDGVQPFAALPPSISVQSANGQHNYWRLKAGETLGRFTGTQEQLAAHFKTDPKVKDLTRVMRVPGLFHQKNPDNPVFVRMVQARQTMYSIDEVLAAYPARTEARPKPGSSSSSSPPPAEGASASKSAEPRASAQALKRAKAFVAKVPPAIKGEHGDEHTFKLCATLTRGFELTDDEALPLLIDWNRRCVPPWSIEELLAKLHSGREYGEEEIGGRLRAEAAKREHKHVDPVDVVAYFIPTETYCLRDAHGHWDMSGLVKAEKTVAMHLKVLGASDAVVECIVGCTRMVVAHGATCAPREGAVVEREGRKLVNTYRPPTLVPRPGAWSSIRRILDVLTGDDPAGGEWLLNWMAAKVQNPVLRPQTAVVLHGAQGTGKGTLGQVMKRILGEDNCVAISQDDLDSPFNAHYVPKLFVEADEVFTSDSLYDRSGYLKHLITDPRVMVNPKNVRQYEVDNCLMWLFTSNNATPVRVEGEGDRRYTVFCNTAPPSEEYKVFLASLFRPDLKFTDAMEAEVAAFAHELLTRPVNKAAVSRPYLNRARAELADASKSSAELFFEEVDARGIESFLPGPYQDSQGCWHQPGWDFDDQGVLQSAVYGAYRQFASDSGFKAVSISTLTKEMSLHRPAWRKVRASTGTRPYLYQGLPREPPTQEPNQQRAPTAAPATTSPAATMASGKKFGGAVFTQRPQGQDRSVA